MGKVIFEGDNKNIFASIIVNNIWILGKNIGVLRTLLFSIHLIDGEEDNNVQLSNSSKKKMRLVFSKLKVSYNLFFLINFLVGAYGKVYKCLNLDYGGFVAVKHIDLKGTVLDPEIDVQGLCKAKGMSRCVCLLKKQEFSE